MSTVWCSKSINFYKITNNMETTKLLFKKVMLNFATFREMSPNERIKLPSGEVKTSTWRMTNLKLKREGYKFRVSDKGLMNETIAECLKTLAL